MHGSINCESGGNTCLLIGISGIFCRYLSSLMALLLFEQDIEISLVAAFQMLYPYLSAREFVEVS